MTTTPVAKQALELYFENCGSDEGESTPRISLHKAVFTHPLLATPAISVRGNTGEIHGTCGSFHWSQGVRALCLLLLSASRAGASGEQASLSGYAGSVASSLDYALGKQPNWLLDMFGVDQRGTALARRLIRRSNPERRRPGPVTLTLNSHFLSSEKIVAYLGTQQLQGPAELTAALQAIDPEYDATAALEKQEQSTAQVLVDHTAKHDGTASNEDGLEPMARQITDQPPAPFDQPHVRTLLKDVFRREFSTSLRNTSIFRKSGLRAVHDSVRELDFMQPLFNKLDRIVSQVDEALTPSERMGIVSDPQSIANRVAEGAPLSVYVPCLHTSSVGIFHYLKKYRQLPLDIKSGHQHSTQVALRLLNRDYQAPPALAVMNVATALHVLTNQKKKTYVPLMLLPGLTQRLVGPKGSKPNTSRGRGALRKFHFMNEIPTLASVYFDDLLKSRSVEKKRATIEETEPCDVADILSSDETDQRAILPCPLYDLHRLFNGSVLLDSPSPIDLKNFSILLVSQELYHDTQRCRMLDILIRDAWLSLLGKQDQLEVILEHMMEDIDFLSTLRRTSGLSLLSPERIQAKAKLSSSQTTPECEAA